MILKLASIFFILIQFLSALNYDKFNISSPINDYADAIQFIISNVFFKRHRSVNVITAVENHLDGKLIELKDHTFRHKPADKSNYVLRLENHSHISIGTTRIRNNNIFFIDSFESFLKLNKSLTPNRFNSRGQYLLIFPNGYLGTNQSREIFKIFWSKGMYNVNLMYERNGVVNMTTFWPYQTNSCSSIEEIQVDVYKNGSYLVGNAAKIFSKNKLQNLHNCSVKIVTFERCPAICYDKEHEEYSGYDREIIEEISKHLNFTLDVKFLIGFQQWGTILENGSVTGALKILHDGKANIGIGNYFLLINLLKILDASTVYFNTPLVLVIPPGQRLSPFEKLLRPFEQIIWILLLITFGIGLLTIAIVNYKAKKLKNFIFGKHVSSPAMNMFIAIIGLQQNVLPRRNFARFILMMFLIFCLVNRNVYQGALYLFLQSDGRHKEVQTIAEMVNKDFSFYVYETYVDFVHNSTRIYQRRIVVRDEVELPFSKMVDDTLRASFMTPLIDVISRNQRNAGKFSLIVCKEQVSIMNIVMYFSKNFHLKNYIDDLLRLFESAGLVNYWTNKHADKRYLNIKQTSTGPKKLNIEHLFGVFNVMLIGNAIEIVIFLFELLVFKLRKMRNERRHLLKEISVVKARNVNLRK